ncbi:MAG TPA: hypothetical protein PLU88_00380 [Armatimonadota bacterium]|nr:hypothetical protein [Armatimonadota bacterium]HPP73569.1 hypothetical protein [Armatimonadota bacterium]
MIRWVLVVIMAVHGLIHAMGGFNELGIAKPEGITGRTIVPISDNTRRVLGVVWLIIVVLFLVAAIGLAVNWSGWLIFAIAALVISQTLIIIWWPDAKFGTIANILIIVGIILIR